MVKRNASAFGDNLKRVSASRRHEVIMKSVARLAVRRSWPSLRPSLPRARVAHRTRGLCLAAAQPLLVEQFPCLADNYGFLLHCHATGDTAAIDAPEAGPICAALERRGWSLTHVLNTHHHWDHTDGNLELKERTGCTIIGPEERIPGRDRAVSSGDTVTFGDGHELDVLDVGGHTRGHIAYHTHAARLAFVGDSLFALGCGRLFEGTPAQAWASLQRLAALPPETVVYCAHEYTEANCRFALSVDPHNEALLARAEDIRETRAAGRPTVPTTIGLERATNPFLRPHSASLRAHLQIPDGESDQAVFARLRSLKDKA